jgi:hypothetical protein
MKIKYINAINGHEVTSSIPDLVEAIVSDTSYYAGEIESLQEKISNLTKLTGNILDALVTKGTLKDNAVREILNSYQVEKLSIIEE